MNDLFIKAKEGRTPTIDFKVNGILLIEGRSICENPIGFYKPVLSWLEELKDNAPESVTFNVKLEFFNTSSGKILLHILNILERIARTGIEVKVVWYYNHDDEEIYQAGLDYETIIKIPFKLVEFHN